LVLGATVVGAFISTIVIFTIVKLIDPTSIASRRRIMAMLFVGSLLWFISSIIGFVYLHFTGNARGLAAGLYFGAFMAAEFESIILSGAFVGKLAFSLPLGAVHPLILILALSYFGGTNYVLDARMVGPGIVAWALAPIMILGLLRIRTRKGDRSITLFQAFLKTWVTRNPAELEKTLEKYAERVSVTTRVIKFQLPNQNLLLILPGIHPGPFYPVGSYNLPGLLFDKARAMNSTALTLHRPGGHERNLATEETSRHYAESIIDFANELSSENPSTNMRGPVSMMVNRTNATGLALNDDTLLFLSSSPSGTDDIDLAVEEKLLLFAQDQGLRLSVVDAHNSINQQRERIQVVEERPWMQMFLLVKDQENQKFKVGFAHSSEIELKHGSDLSDAGIGVLVFDKAESRWVLVIADSNNAISEARKLTEDQLERAGFKLLEICTSDTHNLAARGLTINRGYFALGESTSMPEVARAVVELTGIASARLTSCRYGVGDSTDVLEVLGAESINEFALTVGRSSRFAKLYTKVAIPITALLLVLAVV
jgi:putative membrane protein